MSHVAVHSISTDSIPAQLSYGTLLVLVTCGLTRLTYWGPESKQEPLGAVGWAFPRVDTYRCSLIQLPAVYKEPWTKRRIIRSYITVIGVAPTTAVAKDNTMAKHVHVPKFPSPDRIP